MRRVLAAGLAALVLAGCGSAGPSSSPSSSSSAITLPSALAPSLPSLPPSTTAAPSTPASPTHRVTMHPPASSSSSAPSSAVAPSTPAPRTSAQYRPPAAPHGTVVVLDPGHNGANASHPTEMNQQVPMGFGQTKPCNTTGTSTDAGYPEHAFNFDVAERVRTILQAHGITVDMTRPNDIGFGPCVNERADYGNRVHAAAVVAIHADGAPSSGHGFHVCTASRQPDGASSQTMSRSHDMAVDIHNALLSGSGMTTSTYLGSDGYYPRSDLAGLNLSTRPTTFLELGNMRNSHDASLQSSPSGRQAIASAVANGILAYLAHP